MKHFNWKKIYETGILEIDKQHRHLFDIANAYYTILFSETFTPDNNELLEILKELKEYSKFHYNYEKQIYSEAVVQRYFNIENMLTERIKELEDLSKSNTLIVLYGFAEFLRKWLMKHILIVTTNDFKSLLKKEVLSSSYN